MGYEPDIVKELKKAERLGQLKSLSKTKKDEKKTSDKEDNTIDFHGKNLNKINNDIQVTIKKDITTKKTSEKKQIKSEEFYRTIFENSAVAITLTDENERIISWNKYTEKLLGMSEKDLFNKPVKDLYTPKEWRRMRAFRIRKKGVLTDIETQVYKKDGSLLDVNVSISILKDWQGSVVGSIGIIRDITNQKLAERKIRESE